MDNDNKELYTNKIYEKNLCPKCGNLLTHNDKFCPDCGYKLKSDNQASQKNMKIMLIVFVSVIVLLIAAVAGLLTNIIYSNSSVYKKQPEATHSAEPDYSIEQTSEPNSQLQINEQLNKVKKLYDNGKYQEALKELYSIDEEKMNASQRDNYTVFETNIEKKLNTTNNTESTGITDNGTENDYSRYDSNLSEAYIMGAESGNVYFWSSSSGKDYNGTIPNGTIIYTTGKTSNSRTLIKWEGKYGWVTSKYVNVGNIDTYTSSYHIQGAESGNVYVWKYAYGDDYYAIISNGTIIVPTGNIENGRVQILWGDNYAWVTMDYIG